MRRENSFFRISHSYGVLPGSLKVFPNSLQMLLEEDTMLQKIRFPSKLEQIYVDGDDYSRFVTLRFRSGISRT